MDFDDNKIINKEVNSEEPKTEQSELEENTGTQDNQELEACNQEINALKTTCKQLAADFENFKRRTELSRAHWTTEAQAELLLPLLSIVDDFDRAVAHYAKKDLTPEVDSLLSGFVLINKSLYKFLSTYGVNPITSLQSFDPHLHEAVMQVQSQDHESGSIVEVLQQGFMYKDRVLRPARVTVAQ